ncbi:hypothetical protein R7034_29385, partial [Vibrio sp. 1833]|uniref:hypothetical protein n=1 Tax=Vibrio sp. 1833 TaxID=3074578 RepID=UPI002964533B
IRRSPNLADFFSSVRNVLSYFPQIKCLHTQRYRNLFFGREAGCCGFAGGISFGLFDALIGLLSNA